MTEPRPEDDETQPIDKRGAADGDAGDKAAEHTAPMDPFQDDDDDLASPPDDETVIHDATPDATRVIPPAATAPAWAGRAGVPEPHQAPARSVPTPRASRSQPRTWWTPILLGLLALGLFGVIILVAWLMSRDTAPSPTIAADRHWAR